MIDIYYVDVFFIYWNLGLFFIKYCIVIKYWIDILMYVLCMKYNIYNVDKII